LLAIEVCLGRKDSKCTSTISASFASLFGNTAAAHCEETAHEATMALFFFLFLWSVLALLISAVLALLIFVLGYHRLLRLVLRAAIWLFVVSILIRIFSSQ
jgi:hypothetical protein